MQFQATDHLTPYNWILLLLKDNPSFVLKVLSDVPSSFTNTISVTIIGNFSAAIPAVYHWWWLEFFSISLLVSFIFNVVFSSKAINYFWEGDQCKITFQVHLDGVFHFKRELFSFLEKFSKSSNKNLAAAYMVLSFVKKNMFCSLLQS